MRVPLRGSIVYRLWLALSSVATVFTLVAFGLYVLVTLNDSIQDAHTQTQGKIEAVVTTIARFGITEPLAQSGETSTVERLGIAGIELLAADGTKLSAYSFGDSGVSRTPVDAAMLARSKTRPAWRNVKFEGGFAEPAAISPIQLLLGGSYGEEQIIPLSSLGSNAPGYFRITAVYSGLTEGARELIERTFLTALTIIATILVGSWPFLRHFVSQPLAEYSRLALRIASGEPGRMPQDGHDELSELGRAVNGMADSLTQEATVDPLTGLFNLRHLSRNLEVLVARAVESGSPLSLIVADLDKFKPINDTYGHQAGDRVLRAAADAMRAWAGEGATCWRMGGDEFVVALPDTSAAEGQDRATGLRALINSLEVPIRGMVAQPGISVGVAVCPGDADTAGALLGIADGRMYTAKALQDESRRLQTTGAA